MTSAVALLSPSPICADGEGDGVGRLGGVPPSSGGGGPNAQPASSAHVTSAARATRAIDRRAPAPGGETVPGEGTVPGGGHFTGPSLTGAARRRRARGWRRYRRYP